MNEPVTIPKAPHSKNSTDYAFLVEEGMMCIRKWAGDSWTDHNVHDPGITLLETLCYSLTDLGFRGQLNIRELLNTQLLPEEMALYAPWKALTCNAVTEADFQNLLVDLPIIKYARVKPLVATRNAAKKGLYEVLVEWEEEALNNNLVKATFEIIIRKEEEKDVKKDYDVEFAFSFRDEPSIQAWATSGSFNLVTGTNGGEPLLIQFEEGEINDYFTNIVVHFDAAGTAELTIVVRLVTQPDFEERVELEKAIVAHLAQVNESIGTYRRLLKTVFTNLQTVKDFLSDHRNLCEDFAQFKLSRTQEVAVQATIELSAGADVQQTLITILSSLSLFIDPATRFQHLQELKEQGLANEEIWEGPWLTSGFLKKNQEQDRTVLYASDLLRLMLQDEEGKRSEAVIAVENFSMSSYVGNRLTASNVIECLQLLRDEQYKPQLSLLKTQFSFFRNGVELTYNLEQAIEDVTQKRKKAMEPAPGQNGLLPAANNMQSGWTPETIAAYHSIQYDLPAVYGLRGSTPPGAVPARKAQEKQLRAYLLFFEQILANHLAQLSNTARFFSILTDHPDTYFFQPLYENPQIEYLLKAFDPSAASWADFTKDLHNSYYTRLDALAESPDDMLRRKNNMLDHLLSRFGEDLSELSFLEYNPVQQKFNSPEEMEQRRLATSWRLLRCKSALLQNICTAGAGRAGGLLRTSIKTLSGFEKRIYLKSGILKKERLKLIRDFMEFFEIENGESGKETFLIRNPANEVLLNSTEEFDALPRQRIFDSIRTMVLFAANPFYYRLKNPGTGNWRVIVVNDKKEPIGEAPVQFNNQQDAQAFINRTAEFMYDTYSYEGFYFVEHILLREGTQLSIPVKDSPDRSTATVPDPYSFQITLVFPSGFERNFQSNKSPQAGLPGRFQKQDVRNYITEIVRQESPAHIIPRIFWLDTDTSPGGQGAELSFNNFEHIYINWLEHFVAGTLATDPGNVAQDLLQTMLNNLFKSIAPV